MQHLWKKILKLIATDFEHDKFPRQYIDNYYHYTFRYSLALYLLNVALFFIIFILFYHIGQIIWLCSFDFPLQLKEPVGDTNGI